MGRGGVGAGLSLIARIGAVWRRLRAARPVRPGARQARSEIRRVVEPAPGRARRAGAQGRRHLPRRQALHDRRPDLRAARKIPTTAPRAWHPGTARISTAGRPPTARSTTWRRSRPRIRRCRSRAMRASPISPTRNPSSCASTTAGPITRNRLIDVSVRTAQAARLLRTAASRGCGSITSAAPRSKAPTTPSSRPRLRQRHAGAGTLGGAGWPRRGRSCRRSASRCADAVPMPAGPAVRARPRGADRGASPRRSPQRGAAGHAAGRSLRYRPDQDRRSRPRRNRRPRPRPSRADECRSTASRPALRRPAVLPAAARGAAPVSAFAPARARQRRRHERPRALLTLGRF